MLTPSPVGSSPFEVARAQRRGDIRRSDPFSAGDPGLVEFLGLSNTSLAGVTVTDATALGLSAFWRGVSLIAGTIGTLPLKVHRTLPDGSRERVGSWIDNPHPTLTPFQFTELAVAHALLYGDAFLLHLYGGAGQITGLHPIPPKAVEKVEWADDGLSKRYSVRRVDGTLKVYTSSELTQVSGLSMDGLRGLSLIAQARQSLGTAIAGEQAASRMFGNGLLLGGLLSSKDGDITEDEAGEIKAQFRAKAQGVRNTGDIAFLPTNVEFTPWTMNAEDAQFLESRNFGVEEVSRWTGVPKELLAATGATSWGSGIQELVRAFQRFGLSQWTTRFEQAFSRILPRPQFAEFDYAGLLQPSPEQEIDLLIRQVQAGILTKDEARRIRNLPPLIPAIQE
ncbi:MAG TPA: phage portal protein [Acidimicrobiales bacterium]